MSTLRSLWVRLRSLVRHGTVEHELNDELRYHIDRETERLVAHGMNAHDAAALARRSFGNVEYLKDESRDARGVPLVEHVVRDLGFAFRLARKQPSFAAVVVLSLALGLGATTTVFNLTYNVLFAPLPLPHPEQLGALMRVSGDDRDIAFSWNEYRALRDVRGLGSFSAIRSASQIPVVYGNTREYVNMHFVDGAFFPILGLTPLRGRLVSPRDDAQQATVAVISEQFAEKLFPGDSAVIGKVVDIRGTAFTIIGITPRRFRGVEYPGQFTIAIPLSTTSFLARTGDRGDDRGVQLALNGERLGDQRTLRLIGRLDVDRQTASRAFSLAYERCCVVAQPTGRARPTLQVLDLSHGLPGKDDFREVLGTILLILLGGMGVLLAVVCCNIASLLVVRASARQREIALRLSLGASRGRLVSQLVLETLPLALLGGLGGIVVAMWATAAFVRAIPEWDVYLEMLSFRPGVPLFAFVGAVTLLCSLGSAIYPAVRATRAQIATSLRTAGRSARSRRQGMLARGVVVSQVALAIVLVTAATLFAFTLRNLSHADGGFETENELLLSLEARGTPYEQAGVRPVAERILERMQGVPRVRRAAMASLVPLFGGNSGWVDVDVPGFVSPTKRPTSEAIDAITPGYFGALGIPLRSGRDFSSTDVPRGESVVIVNAAFARRYFGERDAVGRSFRARIHGDSLVAVRIVGVAGDAKYWDLRSAAEPLVYVPLTQSTENWWTLQLVLRVDGSPATVAPDVRRVVEDAAPGMRLRRVSTMQERVLTSMSVQRLATQLAAFAGAMVLVLSLVGLYSVVSFSVTRRTSELGVRMALGASGASVVWLVARETLRVVGWGVALGLPLSFAANSALASQLYGVGAHDPWILAFSVVVFVGVALAACAGPARRAARIDPSIALAAE